MEIKYRAGFSMIELVFVIVVIGILGAIAIPRMGSSVEDARLRKAGSILASVRSSLSTERQKRILRGITSHIGDLGGTFGGTAYAFAYFDNNTSRPVLQYPVKNCTSGQKDCWDRTDATHYKYVFSDGTTEATYKLQNSRLVCDNDTTDCEQLLR